MKLQIYTIYALIKFYINAHLLFASGRFRSPLKLLGKGGNPAILDIPAVRFW